MAKLASKKGKINESSKVDRSKFLDVVDKINGDDRTYLVEGQQERIFPTNYLVLDEVCRLGGMPFGGRVVTIHGKEHGGKSTLTYGITKAYQEFTGEPGVIFDFERTCGMPYLQRMGLKTAKAELSVQQPTSVQTATAQMLEFLEAGVRFFVFDSIPRMREMVDAKLIKNREAYKASVGEHARLMSRFFQLTLPYVAKYDACVLMVNQIRARIDNSPEAAMATKYPSMINLPYTLPGGNDVRYVPSINIEINVKKAWKGAKEDPFILEPEIKDSKDIVATQHGVRILKNKVTGGGYRQSHVWLRPGSGIDDFISVRELARDYGLIERRGGKYVIGDPDVEVLATFDTKDDAIRVLVLEQDQDLLGRLRLQVVDKIRNDDSGRFDAQLSASEAAYLDGEIGGEDDDDDVIDVKVGADGDDFED